MWKCSRGKKICLNLYEGIISLSRHNDCKLVKMLLKEMLRVKLKASLMLEYKHQSLC